MNLKAVKPGTRLMWAGNVRIVVKVNGKGFFWVPADRAFVVDGELQVGLHRSSAGPVEDKMDKPYMNFEAFENEIPGCVILS
jgi:hypothetical protein